MSALSSSGVQAVNGLTSFATVHSPECSFEATFFPSFAAKSKTNTKLTLNGFAQQVRVRTAAKKDHLPWVKLATFGEQRTPIVTGADGGPTGGSLRHDANVLTVTGLEADYDGGAMTFDEAVETLTKQGILGMIYTSPSHTEDGPRWRVLCPFSQPLPPERRSAMLGRLNGLYRGIFAGESWTLSQSYYFGSVNHNPSHQVAVIDGTPIDLHDDLDEIWTGKSETKAAGKPGTTPRGVVDEAAELQRVVNGDSYHEASLRLLGRWAFDGVPLLEARNRLIAAMEEVFPPDRDARWQARRDDVDRCVLDIYGKDARKEDQGATPLRRQVLEPPAERPYEPLRVVNPIQYFGQPIPSRRWIVDRWLPVPSVTLLYADGGVGKTQLAQQLMTSTATSTPWLGLRVEPCRSFGLFCEDDEDELHRRQDAINAQLGVCFGDLDGMRWASGVGQDNVLIRFERDGTAVMTQRFEDLITAAKSHGAKLLVIDTAADTFGGNENDRGMVRQYIGNALARAAREIDGAVLVNAHPSRTGLSTGNLDGGSTGWSNSARSRWSLQRPVDEEGHEVLDSDERILTRRKANYASVGDTMRLRWVDGVMMPADAGETVWTALNKRLSAEQTFLELLDRSESQDRPLSASKNAGNFAPAVFSAMPDRNGFTRREFIVAMEALFASRQIAIVPYGKPSRGTVKLARTPGETAEDGAEGVSE